MRDIDKIAIITAWAHVANISAAAGVMIHFWDWPYFWAYGVAGIPFIPLCYGRGGLISLSITFAMSLCGCIVYWGWPWWIGAPALLIAPWALSAALEPVGRKVLNVTPGYMASRLDRSSAI